MGDSHHISLVASTVVYPLDKNSLYSS